MQYIIPMKVMKWQTLQTTDGKTISPDEKMNAIGYMPVYESISALVDDHGADVECFTFKSIEPPESEAADA